MGRRAKDRLHLDEADQEKAGLARKPASAPMGQPNEEEYVVARPGPPSTQTPSARPFAIVPVGVRVELRVEVRSLFKQTVGDPPGKRLFRIVVTSQVSVADRMWARLQRLFRDGDELESVPSSNSGLRNRCEEFAPTFARKTDGFAASGVGVGSGKADQLYCRSDHPPHPNVNLWPE